MIIVHIFYELNDWVYTFTNINDKFETKITNLGQILNLNDLRDAFDV